MKEIQSFMKGDTVNIYSVDFYKKNIIGMVLLSRITEHYELFEIINVKGKNKIGYTGLDYLDMRVCTCRIVLTEKIISFPLFDYVKNFF